MGDGLIQHDDSKSVYYLNQEQIDRSTFYSTQDKLNIRTYILGIDPNWSEGLPPQGCTFEELLVQLFEDSETSVVTSELDGIATDSLSIDQLSQLLNDYFATEVFLMAFG